VLYVFVVAFVMVWKRWWWGWMVAVVSVVAVVVIYIHNCY